MGIIHEAAALVFRHPGLTDRELGQKAIDEGLCTSSATRCAPAGSLGSTIAQYVREGRLPGVYRNDDTRPITFYPRHDAVPEDIAVTVNLAICAPSPVRARIEDSVSGRGATFTEAILTVLEAARRSPCVDRPDAYGLEDEISGLIGLLRGQH